MSAKINWIQIKLDYLSTNATYRSLAEKYKVSLRAIASRAKNENWTQQKADFCNRMDREVQQRCIDEKAQSFADYAPKLRDRIIQIIEMTTEKAVQTLSVDDALAPNYIKSLTSSVSDLLYAYKDMTEVPESKNDNRTVIEFVNNDWDE